MSSGPDHRKSASQSSILASAPKFSPPSSRNTSPIRRPLHDRSNSQTNQYSGPTIRIVEDPGTDVYSKNPFPSQPSQILPARKKPGYAFEGRGSRVSDSSSVASAVAKIEASTTLVPKPLQHKKAIRHSTSTSTSDADTIVASSFSPSSSRFSQVSTPRTSIFQEEKGLEVLEEEASHPQRPTIRAVTPSISSGGDSVEGHALTPRASAASLASTASADSVPSNRSNHQRNSSSTSQHLSKGHKQTLSSGSHKKQASTSNTAPKRLISKESIESFAYSDTSYSTDHRRTSSHPSPTLHEARQASFTSAVRVHYPIVRAPSSSSLYAESHNFPNITSRMNPRTSQVHHWSSQLSTIPSESERGSRSIERHSQSVSGRSHSQDDQAGTGRAFVPRRRRSQTITSVSSSDNVSSDNFTESSVVVPLPLFSPITRPSNDDRNSDELHDTISPLQSPPLRNKSSFLRRYDSNSRSSSSLPSSSRPSSSQSNVSTFKLRESLPAWARVYYRRGERSSLGAPDTSTESTDSIRIPTAQSGRTNTPSETNFPLSIYRPRNRPHAHMSNRDSMAISEGPIEQDIYVIGAPRRHVTEQFTPRLRLDRRSQAQLSAWKAPSFDESLTSLFFSRQNRQVWLFCFGFLFPFAWMIASFLPLPPDPAMVHEATPSQMDLERQFARELGPDDDRSFQKAMWWRNLNRIMSAIGTLLIGVIIALAILASRMS